MEVSVEQELEKQLLDKLALLENKQWRVWSMAIHGKEKLSKERIARWRKLWNTQWKDLTEEEKDQDREWAYQALDIFKEYIDAPRITQRERDSAVLEGSQLMYNMIEYINEKKTVHISDVCEQFNIRPYICISILKMLERNNVIESTEKKNTDGVDG